MIAAGGLILDPTTGFFRRDGQENWVRLPPKPAQFMALLMQNAGRLVTPDAVFGGLYDRDRQPTEAVLGVMVHRLRRAIEQIGGDRTVLQNIWGSGWRLEGDAHVLVSFNSHQRAALDVVLAQSPPHVRSAADLVREALR